MATKLEKLKCFDELHHRVIAGIAIENIAEWVQEECQEYLEVKRDSLIRVLYRYKATLPPSVLSPVEPLWVYKRIEKMRRGVREVEELEKLYQFQLTRLAIAGKVEETINFLNPRLGQEIAIAKDLLTAMLKAKMELGVLKQTPREVKASLDVTHREVLDGLEDDQRQRLGGLADLVLQALVQQVPRGYGDEVVIPESEVELLGPGETP